MDDMVSHPTEIPDLKPVQDIIKKRSAEDKTVMLTNDAQALEQLPSRRAVRLIDQLKQAREANIDVRRTLESEHKAAIRRLSEEFKQSEDELEQFIRACNTKIDDATAAINTITHQHHNDLEIMEVEFYRELEYVDAMLEAAEASLAILSTPINAPTEEDTDDADTTDANGEDGKEVVASGTSGDAQSSHADKPAAASSSKTPIPPAPTPKKD